MATHGTTDHRRLATIVIHQDMSGAMHLSHVSGINVRALPRVDNNLVRKQLLVANLRE